MGLLTKGPRGTQDVLPKESYQWQVVEDAMRRICSAYGFKEIRTPVFEHTDCSSGRWEKPRMWCKRRCIPSRIKADALSL